MYFCYSFMLRFFVQNSLFVFGGFLFFNFDCSLDVLDLRQNIHLFLSFLTFLG